MRSIINIAGLGHAGGIMALRLLEKGFAVRAFDAGSKICRPNAQVPWGWFRRKSLQQKVRVYQGDLTLPFKPTITRGPMLLTTTKEDKFNRWEHWIRTNETDAQLLRPDEAHKYDIPEDYFEGKGGIFVCDSNDFLVNLENINHKIWDYLDNHPDCEIHENTSVDEIIPFDNKTIFKVNGEAVVCDKAIITVGNQTNKYIDDYQPIMKMTLPWAMVDRLYPQNENQKYIALWNQNSSIQMFDEGDNKIGCGSNSIMAGCKPKDVPYFANLATKGVDNIYVNKGNVEETLIMKSLGELGRLGLSLEITSTDSCTVDMTPTFCPIAKFMGNKNTFVISGFSGSGFTAYEDWFAESVINSLMSGNIDYKLQPFGDRNMYGHLFPNEYEQSYVFA